MRPPNSWRVPGRKPGTSTNVTIGMLNASQKRTNRAALRDASMSSTPASTMGWLATMPTVEPSSRTNPVRNVLAELRADLEEVAFVGDLLDQFLHVIGFVRIVRDEAIER